MILLTFISYKYNLNVETLMNDYNDFCREEQQRLKEGGVSDDFKNFLDKNEERLNEQFSREHAFQTSVRGLKIAVILLLKTILNYIVKNCAIKILIMIFLLHQLEFGMGS